jgi:hypothetical protein
MQFGCEAYGIERRADFALQPSTSVDSVITTMTYVLALVGCGGTGAAGLLFIGAVVSFGAVHMQ